MISLREDTCATTIVFDLKIGKNIGYIKTIEKIIENF